MYEIISKQVLNPNVIKIEILAPFIAKKAKPGQFVILRSFETSERIPLTIADYNASKGSITLIFQTVGASTIELNSLEVKDCLQDLVGPLGNPTQTDGYKNVCIVGGGVGCAIALPVAKEFFALGCKVDTIIGFRNKDLVILENEFANASNSLTIMTDDGSYGQKGLVTQALESKINQNNNYDLVIAIGPLIMMKFVCQTTKKYNIKTIVSMNPVMIDGTGMCGGCRITVGGQTKFACVDGPDFDGHEVDFDEAISRSKMYEKFESHAKDNACNLFKKEVE